jgi:hypothetical protein
MKWEKIIIGSVKSNKEVPQSINKEGGHDEIPFI